MSENIFQTAPWFENLWSHGLQSKPHRYWLWEIEGVNYAYMHLIQDEPYRGLRALSTYYSCLFGPEGDFNAILKLKIKQWTSAIRWLKGIPGSECIRIYPLDQDSQWFLNMKISLHSSGFLTKQFFCFGNWYQIVPKGGFKSYWMDRPSALRNSVSRGKRRLNASGIWHIDIHTSATASLHGGLENAIAAYETVYAQSWKEPEPYKEFLPGLVRMAAQQGWLRLGVLWLNGRPVAAQLWLVADHKANIYKLAYVKGVERLSVGSILTAALMEHTMDVDHVHEVDYLSGDDAYKSEWMASRRERIGLIAFDLSKFKGWKICCTYFIKKSCIRLRRFFHAYKN